MTGYASGSMATSYAYRADGIRASKSSSSVVDDWFYDGQMQMEETEVASSATTVTRYGLGARGVDLILKTDTSGATTGFPIYDGHGNMVATLGRSGTNGYTVGNLRSFDAWGGVRTSNTTGEPNARYVANLGHLSDDESALIYMRARYYEPGTGRFVNQDPSMVGHNWYAYCENDPVNLRDQSGKNPEAIFWGILSTILMSGAVLLGFGEANLTMAISRAMRDAQQLRSMYSIGMETLQGLGRALQRLQDLEKQARNFRRAAKATFVAAVLARLMFFEALLIDIDIAAEGQGGLENVFGGD